MKDRSVIGAAAATLAICCLTPILIVGLGTVGHSARLGSLLLPALALLLGLIAYGLWRQRRTADRSAPAPALKNEGR